MRIAFTLGGSDLGRSGIGIYVREVLPRLVALVNAERVGRSSGTSHPADDLVVIGTREEHEAYATDELDVTRRLLPGALDRPSVSALFHLVGVGALCRAISADVLLLPAANRRITLVSPVPTVAVVHDVAQLSVDDKYDPLRMAYVKHAVMSALRRQDTLVAVSRATRDDLVTALGCLESSIRVVSNGVDTERFRPMAADEPAVIAALAQNTLERPYLLYVSRLEHPGKNHVRLVRAYARSSVAATHRLILVGADWGARDAIEATAIEDGVSARVRWLGFVEDEHLPALIAAADAVVMVGLREGFGLPALEAIAAGRPVCASSTGALPEVVGPHGAACDPFDEASISAALEAVVADETLRARVREDGPTWAAQRGWNATAAGLYEACRAVVESPRHRSTRQ